MSDPTLSHHTPKTPQEIEQAMSAFHKSLQNSGLKSTKQRDAIVERFLTLDQHISAEELLQEVRQIHPRIGYATVYRTLKLMVDQGFAIEKDFGDGYKRYDPVHDQDPHHDHLICIDCRKVLEFNHERLGQELEALTKEMGYSLRRKKLELYAACQIPECPHKPA